MDPAGETEALFRSMEQAMQPDSAAPATADGGAGQGAGWGQAAMQAQHQQQLPPGLDVGPAGEQPLEEPRRGRCVPRSRSSAPGQLCMMKAHMLGEVHTH